MVSKSKPLILILAAAISLVFGAGGGMVQAAEWEHYTLKITSPVPGTVDLSQGGTLSIAGTLTYDNQPVASHPNAVAIMSEGKVIGNGSNIYHGGWTATVDYSVAASQVGTGVHEYYAVWTGDTWGVSTWLSQGHVFYVNLKPGALTYTLTTHVNPSGGGTVNPAGGTYPAGTVVTVTATANTGHAFNYWSGSVSGSQNPIQITMDSNKDITANFRQVAEWERYIIKITSPSPGTVSLSQGGTLAIAGTLTYDGNPVASHPNAVTIMSEGKVIGAGSNIYQGQWTANMQWSWFVNQVGTGVHEYYATWSGDTWGVSTWLSQGHVFYVNLLPAIQKFNLTVRFNPVGGGTVSLTPPGEVVSSPPEIIVRSYDEGTIVNVSASPASGYYFSYWSGDASGTTPNVSITMNTNKDITANFTQIPQNVTLTTHIDGSGTISLNPPGGVYPQGTIVTASAIPSTGWEFDYWSGDATGNNPTITITMNTNKDITAHFKAITVNYTLTTHVDGSGTISLSPSGGTYPSGTLVTVSANPNTGWSFDYWSGDAMGTNPTITITMNTNKDITAHFKQVSVNYTLTTAVAEGQGSISPSGATAYPSGTTVQIAATPASGYRFDYWSGDASGSQNPTTVVMNSNKTVWAHFAPMPQASVTLTMTSIPPEGGTILATQLVQTQQTFPKGATVSITAFSNRGWVFSYWAGDIIGTAPTTSIVMDSNKTAIAVFIQEAPWWQTYQTEIVILLIAVVIVCIAGIAIERR